MKKDLLPPLRKELENNFGRKVLTSRDCLQMVDDIYQKTGYTINTNTLRRFFGLVKTAYNASPSTISILLKYCGLNSLEDLHQLVKSPVTNGSILLEEVHYYLVSLFRSQGLDEDNNPAVESMVEQTILFLERNPGLIDRFQREVSETAAGQYYYYERSVNVDRLNGYYGDGLRFYLRAKHNQEAIVFANAIQVFRYWLTEETGKLENCMAEIAQVTVMNSFPPHILSRHAAARFYQAHVRGEAIDKILAELTKYYSASISRTGILNNDFELIIAEALILTNHYTEGIDYIKKGRSRLSGSRRHHEHEDAFGFWEKMVNSRRSTSLKAIINPVKTNLDPLLSTSILSKRYYTLLNMVATGRTASANFTSLIMETGFLRLSSV